MKRKGGLLFALFLGGLLMFGSIGCERGGDGTQQQPQQQPQQQEQQRDGAPPAGGGYGR